jgi:hypothetical protein
MPRFNDEVDLLPHSELPQVSHQFRHYSKKRTQNRITGTAVTLGDGEPP